MVISSVVFNFVFFIFFQIFIVILVIVFASNKESKEVVCREGCDDQLAVLSATIHLWG